MRIPPQFTRLSFGGLARLLALESRSRGWRGVIYLPCVAFLSSVALSKKEAKQGPPDVWRICPPEAE